MLMPLFVTMMAAGIAIVAFGVISVDDDEQEFDDDQIDQVLEKVAFGFVVYGCGLSFAVASVL